MKFENNRAPVAVILAAGIGSGLGTLTDDAPLCLLTVGGSVMLERMIRNSLSCGISQFVLVLGHKSEQIKTFVDKTFRGIRVTYVMNDRYRDTNSGYSLLLAASAIGSADFVIFDEKVLFDTKIFRPLTDSDLPNVLCFDRNKALAGEGAKIAANDRMRVAAIGTSADPNAVPGNLIGIDKISAVTGPLLFAELGLMMENVSNVKDTCATAYARLLDRGVPFHGLDVSGFNWTEINTAEDLTVANTMFRSPITTVSRGQQRALDEATEKKLSST